MYTQLKKASLVAILCLVGSILLLPGCGSPSYTLAEGQEFQPHLAYISAIDSGGFDPYYEPDEIWIDDERLVHSDERIENRVLYAFKPGKHKIRVRYNGRDALFSSALSNAYPMAGGAITATHEWKAGRAYVAVPRLKREFNNFPVTNICDSIVLEGTFQMLRDEILNKISDD